MSPHRRHSGESKSKLNQSVSSTSVQALAFNRDTGPWPCATPNNACLFLNGANPEHVAIAQDDLFDAVKIICSYDQCTASPYLHSACFESFEESVLQYLKSCPRAKSWTDKQLAQNLWTKRGYELVFQICECLCGHGHIRKDLDWVRPDPPPGTEMDSCPPPSHMRMANGVGDPHGKRKRKKSKSQSNSKSTIAIGLPMLGGANNSASAHHGSPSNAQMSSIRRSDAQNVPRNRTNSISSTTSGSSSILSGSPVGFSPSGSSPSSHDGASVVPKSRNLIQERMRHDSGGSIFLRRQDYSSFNVLPKHKINSYHIKMEDECSIGNDETRIFILSSYASNKMNRVPCVVCASVLHIFDRYPLLDGTFFLSPRQHNKSCIKVKHEGKTNYLTAVCMGCLEGWTANVCCRICMKPWTGSHLILGTMYSYDIFAANPCCAEKLKCNNCHEMVIHPDQRFNFFSDYSQVVSCPNCGVQDTHFCKSLAMYVKQGDPQKLARLQSMQVRQYQQAMAAISGLRVHRVNSA